MSEPPPILDYESPSKPATVPFARVPFAPMRCEPLRMAVAMIGLEVGGLLAAALGESTRALGVAVIGAGVIFGLLTALGCVIMLFLPGTDRYSCLLALLLALAPTAAIVLVALSS